MQSLPRSFWLLATLALAGCLGGDDLGPGGQLPEDPGKEAWQNVTPRLTVASPGVLSVGDNLVLLGKDFIPTERGQALVVLKGTYFDDAGTASPVDLEGKAMREGKRTDKLAWRLWPSILFHPTGDRLGYFVGDVRVVNQANDGSQLVSDPLPVKITVGPSLLPRLIRPTNSSCQSVVSQTIEDTPFAFVVEAIGLRAATQDNPLTFYWTFLAEHWHVAMNYGTGDPVGANLPKTGAFQLEDVVTSGRVSTVQDGGNRNFLLKVGSDLLGDSRLKELRTAKVPAEGNSFFANVNVAVVDASGKSARLAVPLDVSRLADLHYDGSVRIAERYPATPVSDCIPATGTMPAQVTYSEDKAESHVRSMGFNFNASAGLNVAPIPQNPWALGINFSAGFGTEVGATVSSSNSKGLNISGQIMPGNYGVFYRQTTKLYRIGKIVGRNKCGQTVDLGEAILTDWLFTPELATGPKCIPQSRLPKAEKFLD